jgi:hypothetical protein
VRPKAGGVGVANGFRLPGDLLETGLRHQGIAGPQYRQILPHFPTAVLDRVQRLWVHTSQAGQVIGIDPIILALATLRSVHEPRVWPPALRARNRG